jgi:hypothetical protein
LLIWLSGPGNPGPFAFWQLIRKRIAGSAPSHDILVTMFAAATDLRRLTCGF